MAITIPPPTLPSVLSTPSGAGAAPTAAAAPKANLDAFSGKGQDPVTGGVAGDDMVSKAEAKALPLMNEEQKSMYDLQKAVSRQSEASSMLASVLKADHDARMAILQKIG